MSYTNTSRVRIFKYLQALNRTSLQTFSVCSDWHLHWLYHLLNDYDFVFCRTGLKITFLCKFVNLDSRLENSPSVNPENSLPFHFRNICRWFHNPFCKSTVHVLPMSLQSDLYHKGFLKIL